MAILVMDTGKASVCFRIALLVRFPLTLPCLDGVNTLSLEVLLSPLMRARYVEGFKRGLFV